MGDRNIPASKDGRRPRGVYARYVVRLMSRYPDGVTGAAMLLLRLAAAVGVFPAVDRLALPQSAWWLAEITGGAISLALAAGVGTRWAAILLVIGLAAVMIDSPADLALLLVPFAGAGGALALLGPGAYSVDAHIVGRRVIRLDPPSPDRGTPR